MNKPIEDMTREEMDQELKRMVMSLNEEQVLALLLWIDENDEIDNKPIPEIEALTPERKAELREMLKVPEAKVKQEQAE